MQVGDRVAVLRRQRRIEKAGQLHRVVGVLANPPLAGRELAGIAGHGLADTDVESAGAAEEGVNADGGQKTAGVLAKGDLLVGPRALNRQLTFTIDRSRHSADLVELRGNVLERGVSVQAVQIDADIAGLRQAGGGIVNLDLERTVDRRKRQPRGIQRLCGIVDAALAGHGLVAGEPLSRRIDLVELVGQRAGKGIQLVEKAPQDVFGEFTSPAT